MNLRDYEQTKFEMAEILRSAAKIAPPGNLDWRERLRELFVRLAEDRFNLVVVGRFNRGKTSLMNAILGSDRLPVGIVPLTSVVTAVSYGTTEEVIFRFQDSILSTKGPIDSLPEYITQEGNPGNVRGLKLADVRLHSEILRRGFHFVDTPGLGSAIAENTRTTEAYLPEGDAFIVVTSYESPFSEDEARFFKTASSWARRIFVVLNKQDTVLPCDRNKVLAYVKDQLSNQLGARVPRVFSVSARDGLEAKQSRDLLRLAKSGIPALEEDLINFLIEEKRMAFLSTISDRLTALLEGLQISNARSALVARNSCLRGSFIDRKDLNLRESEPIDLAAPVGGSEHLKSCEICMHVNDRLWDVLSKFQYDLGVDQEERQRFADLGGFCSTHTWQYHSMASSYGICAAYPVLFDRLSMSLRAAVSARGAQKSLSDDIQMLLSDSSTCPLCKVRSAAEAEAISNLASRLSNCLETELESLSSVCVPHLCKLSSAIEDTDIARRLTERQAALLERVAEDMRRYILKRDATRRHLQSVEEETAAERALTLVAGRPNAIR